MFFNISYSLRACSRKKGHACDSSEKGQKMGKKGQNIWKFGQKCTKFEYILTNGSFMGTTIACMKQLEYALPLINTRTCGNQEIINFSFSENFAHVLNKWSLTTSSCELHSRLKMCSTDLMHTVPNSCSTHDLLLSHFWPCYHSGDIKRKHWSESG